jgi:indolepyruvate ferredoxin oxidoreductase alpha subunit
MHALLSGRPGERRLLLGNEAIVRGALEAGVALATTYPGTPASEIGDRFYQLSRKPTYILNIPPIKWLPEVAGKGPWV